jgi:calcineurin-like phosphoesterase family protein
MSNVWFISDTHFNHHKIILLESARASEFDSIEEHDETLVERWNEVVRPNDVVWHLGDVAMWDKESLGVVARLAGIKRLLLGNHDNLKPQAYIDAGFQRVYAGVEKYGAWLSHIPIHPMSVERYGVNIHGHTHTQRATVLADAMDGDYLESVTDRRYICVSAEQIGYQPVSLDEVRQRMRP